jgi:hypothetical protein
LGCRKWKLCPHWSLQILLGSHYTLDLYSYFDLVAALITSMATVDPHGVGY